MLSAVFSLRCTASKDDRDMCHCSHRRCQYRPAGGNYPKYSVSMMPDDVKCLKQHCVVAVSVS